MSYDINSQQIDIENLFKQNANDLSSIKELYRKLKDLEEKITQIKYIDSKLADKLKKEYESLKKVILNENIQIQLTNDINEINSSINKTNNDINEVSSQLEHKAKQSDLEVERARIDSFTRLSEGSTTGDAELIDARIGSDGVNYNNLGSAIRTQLNNINNNIENIIGCDIEYNYSYTEGGYINNTNGDVVTYDNWKYTDFIVIDNNIKSLKVSTTLKGSYSYNAFYDENKNFISNFKVDSSIVDIPTNAKYCRVSVTSDAYTKITNIFETLNEKCTLEDVKELISGSGATDIITLNKDVEPFVIQASEGLGQIFADTTKPLVFSHFSDVHTRQPLWNRIVEYNNHYKDYIKFSIHTGDYCGGNRLSYIDLYANGTSCNIPLLNCVGNHDTYLADNSKGDKATTHDLLFNHTNNWDVHFMNIENSMTYHKDFADEKIRLIVLDYYYDIDSQCTWLLERLNGAKALGYHVITCMHEMTNVIANKLDTTFQTIDNFEALGGNKWSISKFDKVIGDWIKNGGVHVANFAGHEHSDFIGYTENNVLNVCVQAATDNIIWTDGKRVQGTKTWDCFNVVSVETSTGTLKLIRVGNNSDHYLREKKILSYDYINKKIISS